MFDDPFLEARESSTPYRLASSCRLSRVDRVRSAQGYSRPDGMASLIAPCLTVDLTAGVSLAEAREAMRQEDRRWLVWACILGAFTGCAAHPPTPRLQVGIHVPMRDGVSLVADVKTPGGSARCSQRRAAATKPSDDSVARWPLAVLRQPVGNLVPRCLVVDHDVHCRTAARILGEGAGFDEDLAVVEVAATVRA